MLKKDVAAIGDEAKVGGVKEEHEKSKVKKTEGEEEKEDEEGVSSKSQIMVCFGSQLLEIEKEGLT